jgi:signal transduction histidine kinase
MTSSDWRSSGQVRAAQWALSWQAVTVAAPLWVLGLTANEPAAYGGPVALAQTLLISTAGYAVMAAVMLLAGSSALVRRVRGRQAALLVGVVVAVAAELRLIVLVGGLRLAELPDDVALLTRLIGSAALALFFAVSAVVVLDAWARYRSERRQLLTSLLSTAAQTDVHELPLAELAKGLRRNVSGSLAESRAQTDQALDAVRDALTAGDDGRAQLRDVQGQVDRGWREISHEVWSRFNIVLPRFSAREAIYAFALTRPFPLLGVAAGAAGMGWFYFARFFEPALALAAGSLWLAGAVAVAVVSNWLVRAAPRAAVTVVALALLLLLANPLLTVGVGLIPAVETDLIVRGVLLNVNVVISLVLLGAATVVRNNREAKLAALRRGIDDALFARLQFETRFVAEARAIASDLHGSSRTGLLAATLQLEAAIDRGDRSAAVELVEQVRASIHHAESAVDAPPVIDVTAVEELITQWQSVVDIAVEGSWRAVPNHLAADVHSVVSDAFADAMRHGNCSRIDIVVQGDADGVELRIANDGIALSTHATAGLGSANLDRLAASAWSRATDAAGRTVLTVRLGARSAPLASPKKIRR